MLDGILIEMTIDSLKQVRGNLFHDQLISVLLIETQIGKVSAPLSMMLDILSVFEHVNHKVNGFIGSHFVVAVENICHMSKRCSCVQCSLSISGQSTKLNDGANNLLLSLLHFLLVIGSTTLVLLLLNKLGE